MTKVKLINEANCEKAETLTNAALKDISDRGYAITEIIETNHMLVYLLTMGMTLRSRNENYIDADRGI